MLQALRVLTIPQLEEQIRRCQVQCQKQDNHRYEITIQTDDASIAMALECLRLLMGVSQRMHQAMARAETRAKGEQISHELHDRQRAIAKAYWDCRRKGVKHRKALAQVVETCPEAGLLRFTSSEVNYCVRSYPEQELEGLTDATECKTLESRIARSNGHGEVL